MKKDNKKFKWVTYCQLSKPDNEKEGALPFSEQEKMLADDINAGKVNTIFVHNYERLKHLRSLTHFAGVQIIQITSYFFGNNQRKN